MKSSELLFHGCGTALITPFQPDGSLDEAAIRRLVRFQVQEGINFLVPAGSTGEAATLKPEEQLRLIAIVVDEARKAGAEAGRQVPVLAGAGSNNTAAVVEFARAVEKLGVDGILSVSPYYNKPTQEGLFQHFAAIAGAVSVPVVPYNVPGRTGSNIEPATLLRLAAIDNIVGVKEASGNLGQMGAILADAPAGFAVLSGDDALTLPLLALGGHGLISVASNEIPGPMTELVRLARAGDFAGARRIHYRYLPLMDVNFIESNPIPVKAVMARMGLCQEVYRLPLVPLTSGARARLEAVLQKVELAGQPTTR